MNGGKSVFFYPIGDNLMSREKNNQPLGRKQMPHFAGIASMFRLSVNANAENLDIALLGIPLDLGTSTQSGTRFGPREIRIQSMLASQYGL
jgi:guanidinobutyrase